MNSLNPHINAMMAAYRQGTGYDMPLNCSVERWCLEAILEGVTPEDITLSILSRRKFNARNSAQKSMLLHRMIMSADDRAIVLNEAAEMRALARVKVLDPAKASVLASTHRPPTVPETQAVHVGDVKLLADLRKAAQ